MSRIEIKPAELSDVDWLLTELEKFSEFFGTRINLFADTDYQRFTLEKMITEHLVLVAWRDATRLGFVSGYVHAHPYNPEIKCLSETFWWVSPEYRGSRAGLMLLDKFTEWGEDNCDWVFFSLEHHSPVKDDCLLRRGYKLQERNYLKEVD